MSQKCEAHSPPAGLGALPDSSFLLQSEPEGFSHFHLYVCAAFLIKWRKEILDEEDFQVRGRRSEALAC